MQHGQTEISIDDVRCHQWLTNKIAEAPLHWRHHDPPAYIRYDTSTVYSCRRPEGSMFLHHRTGQTLPLLATGVLSSCVCWCIRPHVALHHPTSPTCASRLPPCQHDNRFALLLVVTSWCQECESSSAIGHSRSPAQKRGTACQSTSGRLTPSLPSRTVSRHICLNCRTASRSDDFDVDRRPCSDSRHVTAPYKLALYYYYYYYFGVDTERAASPYPLQRIHH